MELDTFFFQISQYLGMRLAVSVQFEKHKTSIALARKFFRNCFVQHTDNPFLYQLKKL